MGRGEGGQGREVLCGWGMGGGDGDVDASKMFYRCVLNADRCPIIRRFAMRWMERNCFTWCCFCVNARASRSIYFFSVHTYKYYSKILVVLCGVLHDIYPGTKIFKVF